MLLRHMWDLAFLLFRGSGTVEENPSRHIIFWMDGYMGLDVLQ